MSMRLLTAMAVVAVLAMSAMVAMAADGDRPDGPRQNMDPAQRWAQLLERSDADDDGKISKDEFKGPDEVFDRLDKNGDGAITEDEMKGAGNRGGQDGRQQMDPAERWKSLLERFDKDNDGNISEAEFEGPDRVFGFLDKNGDGVITEDEGKQAGGGPGGRQTQDAAARFGKMLENWDADGDGQISKDEYKGRPENFARLDGDGDTFITEQEFVDGMAQMMQRRNPIQEMLALWDTDADGRVSWDEWAAFFAIADVNDDGFLTQDELMKALRPPKPEPKPDDAPPPAAPGGGFAPAE